MAYMGGRGKKGWTSWSLDGIGILRYGGVLDWRYPKSPWVLILKWSNDLDDLGYHFRKAPYFRVETFHHQACWRRLLGPHNLENSMCYCGSMANMSLEAMPWAM